MVRACWQTEFLQELQVLGACKHENLLPLIGFSADENARGESQVTLLPPRLLFHARLVQIRHAATQSADG